MVVSIAKLCALCDVSSNRHSSGYDITDHITGHVLSIDYFYGGPSRVYPGWGTGDSARGTRG